MLHDGRQSFHSTDIKSMLVLSDLSDIIYNIDISITTDLLFVSSALKSA
jgi:hypothetical protein